MFCIFLSENRVVYEIMGARGGLVVKALRYKPAGRGSIPDGVTGIFQ